MPKEGSEVKLAQALTVVWREEDPESRVGEDLVREAERITGKPVFRTSGGSPWRLGAEPLLPHRERHRDVPAEPSQRPDRLPLLPDYRIPRSVSGSDPVRPPAAFGEGRIRCDARSCWGLCLRHWLPSSC